MPKLHRLCYYSARIADLFEAELIERLCCYSARITDLFEAELIERLKKLKKNKQFPCIS